MIDSDLTSSETSTRTRIETCINRSGSFQDITSSETSTRTRIETVAGNLITQGYVYFERNIHENKD